MTQDTVTITLSRADALRALQYLAGGAAPAAPQPAPTPQPAAYTPPAPQPPMPAPAPAPVAHQPPMPAPAPAPAPAPVAQQPAAAPGGITLTHLTQAAQAYAKAYKPQAAMAVLAQFGITKVSDARPDQYPQLLQSLQVAA